MHPLLLWTFSRAPWPLGAATSAAACRYHAGEGAGTYVWWKTMGAKHNFLILWEKSWEYMGIQSLRSTVGFVLGFASWKIHVEQAPSFEISLQYDGDTGGVYHFRLKIQSLNNKNDTPQHDVYHQRLVISYVWRYMEVSSNWGNYPKLDHFTDRVMVLGIFHSYKLRNPH